MARMRTYKANGGSIKEYYSNIRTKKKEEKRIIELDEKMINKVKSIYNNIDPDTMIDIPYISRIEGRWLKDMLKASYF